MILRALGLALIIAGPLDAQAISSLNPPTAPDLSGYATTDSVNAAANAANNAQTTANAANALATTAVQPAALAAAATQNLAIMAATTPQFAGGSSAYLTLANLLTTYPCATNTNGMLAHVSDVYGTVATTLVCESNGSTFYWHPQRTDFAAAVPQTSGTLTLTPLLSAPIVYLSATPASTVTVNLSAVNAWPGATFHLYAPSTISLSGINISGLVGGGTVPLLQGSDKVVTYVAGAGWKSN